MEILEEGDLFKGHVYLIEEFFFIRVHLIIKNT